MNIVRKVREEDHPKFAYLVTEYFALPKPRHTQIRGLTRVLTYGGPATSWWGGEAWWR